MAFETLDLEVGDAVNVFGKQQSGTVESITIVEYPDVQCDVVVKLTSPDVYMDFSIYEGETFDSVFEKVV